MGVCHSVNDVAKEKKEIVTKLSVSHSDDKLKEMPEAVFIDKKSKVKQTIKKLSLVEQIDEETKSLIMIYPKNDQLVDQQLIKDAIRHCSVLKDLDGLILNEVISKMSLCKVQQGAYIIKEGFPGFYFFIIQTGKVAIELNKVHQKTLVKGDAFGELALILDSDRTASASAEVDTTLWCLERSNFKKIIEYIAAKRYEENKYFIDSIKALSKSK